MVVWRKPRSECWERGFRVLRGFRESPTYRQSAGEMPRRALTVA